MAAAKQPGRRQPILDILAQLPSSRVAEYQRGQRLYGPEQLPIGVYRVIDGQIKITRISKTGRQVVVQIYHVDELFGECAMCGEQEVQEHAVALRDTKIMYWTTKQIRSLILKRPLLASSLLQLLIQRSLDLKRRLLSLSRENTGQRLARTLLVLGERLGVPDHAGRSIRINFP